MTDSKLISFWVRIKSNFHRFCDGTSLHGFTELYYAPTTFWQVFWAFCIIGAFSVTVYQTSGAIDQYMHQTSSTTIQPASKHELVYPPLKICVAHWVHWIDWEIAQSLGLSKEATLYGMSYLTNVYSSEIFNVTKAKVSLNLVMKNNNINNIEELYTILGNLSSKVFPYGINTESQFVFSDENLFFCLSTNGTNIFDFLQKPQSEDDVMPKNYIELTLNAFDKTHMVNEEEYNSYMAEWIYRNTKQYYLKEGVDGQLDNYALAKNNYSNVHPPNILFSDGYSTTSLILDSEVDEYYVSIKASVQRMKNKPSHICKESTLSFASDTSCGTYCLIKARAKCNYASYKDFSSQVRIKNSTKPSDLKRKKVNFFSQSIITTTHAKEITSSAIADNNETDSEFHQVINTTSNSTTKIPSTCNITEEYHRCSAEYACLTSGCEIWTYDVTVTTRSLYNVLNDVSYKTFTSVYIHYPQHNDVLIMTETDSKSWEDFIGNVGGLLGIWTGASIVSILQFLYLCCCMDLECSHVSQHMHRNIGSNASNNNKAIGITNGTISLDDVHHIIKRKKKAKHSANAANATGNVNTLFVK